MASLAKRLRRHPRVLGVGAEGPKGAPHTLWVEVASLGDLTRADVEQPRGGRQKVWVYVRRSLEDVPTLDTERLDNSHVCG